MELRKQSILKAVVREFTVTALPVGSQVLARRHLLDLSSATIRNELAELADLGYLEQPHPSAGRIPTDLGYRYFVDFLMELDPVPTPVGAHISDQLRVDSLTPMSWVDRVASTLASVTRAAAIVTDPHGPRAKVKHVELISLEPCEVLLILLVEGNLLRQQVVAVSTPIDQSNLTRLANRINQELGGLKREAVADRIKQYPGGVERELIERIAAALEEFEQGVGSLVVHDGVRNLIREPEFAAVEKIQGVLEILEETRVLASVIQDLTANTDLQIVIGSEHQTEQLRPC
ncbi:MAG: heat-inducible transcriptional repressor HrcA [Candidatus Dormibacteraceae bacterium]